MRCWFDTEFYEDGRTIKPISIGIVREDGSEYYAEFVDAIMTANKSKWLKKNVLPHLRGITKESSTIANDIVFFIGEKPEIWAYYADYDWILLCQLFGTMMDLPKGWPKYCRDVKQLCWMLGDPPLPAQLNEHNALADAKWTKAAYERLNFMLTEGGAIWLRQ